jgi:HAD superfamily hydrolase (TIGR01509 family)
MSWDAVIFDCDGVLVDSEPISTRVFTEMLATIGLTMSMEESAERFIGRSMPACMAVVEELLGRPVPEGFVEEYHRKSALAFQAELVVVPGVVEVLDWLPWPHCVASGSDHERLRITLTKTGLYPRFEGRIYSCHDVARGKPDPDVFLYAAERMGVRPERCAVVEDSVLGVQAGVAAGMSVFAYTGTADVPRLREAGAQTVFDEMAELPALLERGWKAA